MLVLEIFKGENAFRLLIEGEVRKIKNKINAHALGCKIVSNWRQYFLDFLCKRVIAYCCGRDN